MRTITLAAFALSLLGSGTAFADVVQIGSATRAPVFAVTSGTSAAVADIGTAWRAPLFAVTSGNGHVLTDIGSASRAPMFAAVPARNTKLALGN